MGTTSSSVTPWDILVPDPSPAPCSTGHLGGSFFFFFFLKIIVCLNPFFIFIYYLFIETGLTM